MIYIGAHALIVPGVAPRESGRARSMNCSPRSPTCCRSLFLIAGTLGGIYAGLVTTTEAATDRLHPRHCCSAPCSAS